MAKKQTEEGGKPQDVNLHRYREVKDTLFNSLPEEDLDALETKAAAFNASRKSRPERSEIYK